MRGDGTGGVALMVARLPHGRAGIAIIAAARVDIGVFDKYDYEDTNFYFNNLLYYYGHFKQDRLVGLGSLGSLECTHYNISKAGLVDIGVSGRFRWFGCTQIRDY